MSVQCSHFVGRDFPFQVLQLPVNDVLQRVSAQPGLVVRIPDQIESFAIAAFYQEEMKSRWAYIRRNGLTGLFWYALHPGGKPSLFADKFRGSGGGLRSGCGAGPQQ
jgi:hypothetical protein